MSPRKKMTSRMYSRRMRMGGYYGEEFIMQRNSKVFKGGNQLRGLSEKIALEERAKIQCINDYAEDLRDEMKRSDYKFTDEQIKEYVDKAIERKIKNWDNIEKAICNALYK
jgi:hypothetical protein